MGRVKVARDRGDGTKASAQEENSKATAPAALENFILVV